MLTAADVYEKLAAPVPPNPVPAITPAGGEKPSTPKTQQPAGGSAQQPTPPTPSDRPAIERPVPPRTPSPDNQPREQSFAGMPARSRGAVRPPQTAQRPFGEILRDTVRETLPSVSLGKQTAERGTANVGESIEQFRQSPAYRQIREAQLSRYAKAHNVTPEQAAAAVDKPEMVERAYQSAITSSLQQNFSNARTIKQELEAIGPDAPPERREHLREQYVSNVADIAGSYLRMKQSDMFPAYEANELRPNVVDAMKQLGVDQWSPEMRTNLKVQLVKKVAPKRLEEAITKAAATGPLRGVLESVQKVLGPNQTVTDYIDKLGGPLGEVFHKKIAKTFDDYVMGNVTKETLGIEKALHDYTKTEGKEDYQKFLTSNWMQWLAPIGTLLAVFGSGPTRLVGVLAAMAGGYNLYNRYQNLQGVGPGGKIARQAVGMAAQAKRDGQPAPFSNAGEVVENIRQAHGDTAAKIARQALIDTQVAIRHVGSKRIADNIHEEVGDLMNAVVGGGYEEALAPQRQAAREAGEI